METSLEEQFLPIIQMIERLASMNQLSATERIMKCAHEIMMIHRHHPLLAQFMHSELMSPTLYGGKVVIKYISQLSQLIQMILMDGVASGEFKSNLNINDGTVLLIGMIDFHYIAKPFLKDLAIQSEQSEEQYFAQAIPMFLDGIIRRREHE